MGTPSLTSQLRTRIRKGSRISLWQMTTTCGNISAPKIFMQVSEFFGARVSILFRSPDLWQWMKIHLHYCDFFSYYCSCIRFKNLCLLENSGDKVSIFFRSLAFYYSQIVLSSQKSYSFMFMKWHIIFWEMFQCKWTSHYFSTVKKPRYTLPRRKNTHIYI